MVLCDGMVIYLLVVVWEMGFDIEEGVLVYKN